MSPATVYDVDTYGDEQVRAPFRVPKDAYGQPLHASVWGQPKKTPTACTSDNVQLDTFRATTAVGRTLTGAKP